MRDLIPEEVQQVYGAQGEGKGGLKFEKAHFSKAHWTGQGKNRKFEKSHFSKAHWTNPKKSRG